MDLKFDLNLGNSYKSSSQRIRVLSEDWVARNLFCPVCGMAKIERHENNRPVADFFCAGCNADFELKGKQSKSGDLGVKIMDGAYLTMISRITSLQNPNFFFMSYYDNTVNSVVIVPNYFFSPSIIEKRKPLAETARRAGWVGCNINLNMIPESGKIYIIKDRIAFSVSSVVAKYQKTVSLVTKSLDSRGWLLDTLACVEKMPELEFSLDQVYRFEAELQLKYPDNHFIKDKLRQQLQVLRDKGFVEFLGRGKYLKTLDVF